MEISTENPKAPPERPTTSRDALNFRTTSTLRIKYEAERGVIRKKLGDLEAIRELTGLSQRKICQLLLVDPSAWSRWTKNGDAPPHIYRALQWYLALNEKYPALDVGFWLNSAPRGSEAEVVARQARGVESMRGEVQNLRQDLAKLKARLEIQRIFGLALAATIGAWLIFR